MEHLNNKAPNDSQPNLDTDAVKLKAEHDALYGKYSKAKETLYKTAEIAFSINPEVINELDEDIKNKLIKDKFGYSSFEEALAVLWEWFYKSNDNKPKGNDEDYEIKEAIAELQKDKKINEFRQKQKEEELAIDLFISKNPQLFVWVENPKELLQKEVKKLTDGIPLNERIEDASFLVKTKYSKQVTFANQTSWWKVIVSDNWISRNPSLAKIFWNKI